MTDGAYAVIMAGGKGERFWPLSTSRRPKQFLSLVGGKPLLQLAVERLVGLIPPERILVITGADFVEETQRAAPSLPTENIIGEPVGRDTAAACALATALIHARDPSATLCVLTADHVIGEPDRFLNTLRECLAMAASRDAIVTIGIPPAFASTGFGYIEVEGPVAHDGQIEFLKARRFVEKPDAETAEGYVAAGRFFWNSGMFAWSVSTFLSELAECKPEMKSMADRLSEAAAGGTLDECLRREYASVEKISVDYAVMEKARNIVMARGAFAWDDVGTWSALENHFNADAEGNMAIGACEALDARGNVVLSEGRLTALIGVEDLVVVQAEGATLVCRKDRTEDVKKLVQKLKEKGGYDHLL